MTPTRGWGPGGNMCPCRGWGPGVCIRELGSMEHGVPYTAPGFTPIECWTPRGYIRPNTGLDSQGLYTLPISSWGPRAYMHPYTDLGMAKRYIPPYRAGQQGLSVSLYGAERPGVAPIESRMPGVIRSPYTPASSQCLISPCTELDIQGYIQSLCRDGHPEAIYIYLYRDRYLSVTMHPRAYISPLDTGLYLDPYGEQDTKNYPYAEEDAQGLYV